MIRVWYDGVIWSRQTMGGANRYFARIIEGLPAEVQPTLTVERTRDINFPASPRLRVLPCARQGPQAIDWVDCDVFHPTYFELLSGGDILASRAPVVLTVHDTLHELYPELADPAGVQQAWKKRLIPAVAHLICVSQNTKKDVMDIFGVPESRISVVHHASSLSVAMAEPEPQGQQAPPYFLYVGHRYGYKNVPRLLGALAMLRRNAPEARLLFVGDPFSEGELELLDAFGVAAAVRNLGRVSDARLAGLYARAVALVYPSLYEGFGIPLLEAMSCDCPVIASNTSSIPEVAGDAGLLFDPEDTEALAGAMERLLTDKGLRQDMVERGRSRARQFSWDRAVGQTLAVYRKLTQG